MKNDVTVWDPEPGTARSTSLVSHQARACVFFEHVFVGFCPIEHVHAAHQDLAQGRVRLVEFVFSSQEADASVSEAARSSLEAAHVRPKQGISGVVTVVCDQTGYSIHQASSTSKTRQSRHLPFVRRCTATFLANDDTACQWGETRKSESTNWSGIELLEAAGRRACLMG